MITLNEGVQLWFGSNVQVSYNGEIKGAVVILR